MQEECARYVSTRDTGGREDRDGGVNHEELISGEVLVALYTSLKQGQSVKAWCIEHGRLLDGVDVRRFVTFGVIKGFLYRVHKYAIATTPGHTTNGDSTTSRRSSSRTISPLARADDDGHDDDHYDDDEAREAQERKRTKRALGRYLDGTHCFDAICTELGISERELMGELKRWGDVQIIHR